MAKESDINKYRKIGMTMHFYLFIFNWVTLAFMHKRSSYEKNICLTISISLIYTF